MKNTLRGIFALLVVAITGLALFNASANSGGAVARNNLTIIAPAAAGGGWDSVARSAQQVMRTTNIVNNVQVVNIPGAGGTIGLNQVGQMEGDAGKLLVTGSSMVGGQILNDSATKIQDITPIARLADDYAALVVPGDSDIKNLDDFMTQWTADPQKFSIAGGSLGSTDHLLVGHLAKEVGINPAEAKFIAYSGGGEMMNAMLSHTVPAGVGTYNELSDQIESGTLRIIAISSPEPLPDVEAKTFVEQGYDVTISNWRGVLAPAGLSEEEKQELVDIVTEMHDTADWKAILERNAWDDTFMTGAEFEAFLTEQNESTTEIIRELGL